MPGDTKVMPVHIFSGCQGTTGRCVLIKTVLSSPMAHLCSYNQISVLCVSLTKNGHRDFGAVEEGCGYGLA